MPSAASSGDEVLDLVHGELVTQLDGGRAHGVSGNGLQLDRELSSCGGQCLPVLGGQGVEDVLAVGLRGGDDLGRSRALGVGDDEAVAGLGGVRGSTAAFRGCCRRRCGGAAAAEDSGTNQADGDDGDHRDGGGNDDQDAFSAEGHSHVERLSVGTPRGWGGREPGVRRGWHGTAAQAHRRLWIGLPSRFREQVWLVQTCLLRPLPWLSCPTRLPRITTISTRTATVRRQTMRPIGPVTQAVRIAMPMVV